MIFREDSLTPGSRFVSKALGPPPIINAFLDQLRLEQFSNKFFQPATRV
jgi:hypothetical protein